VSPEDLLPLFTRILRDLLANEAIVLRRESSRSDVPEWDSFSYVNFIVAVEMELGIKFGVADVESFKNVGEIVDKARSLMK